MPSCYSTLYIEVKGFMALSISSNSSIVGVGIAESQEVTTDAAGNVTVVKNGKNGTVKPDGETILVDKDGTIHGAARVEIASTKRLGVVVPDGKTITMDKDGRIHGTTIWGKAKNPNGTSGTLGTVMPDGESVLIDTKTGIISAKSAKQATDTEIGLVKIDGKTVVANDATDPSKVSVKTDPSMYVPFVGATSVQNGTSGFVKAPSMGIKNIAKLKGDGTWEVPNVAFPSDYCSTISDLVQEQTRLRKSADTGYQNQINMITSGDNINLDAIPSDMQIFKAKGVNREVKLYMKGSKSQQKIASSIGKDIIACYPAGFKVVRKEGEYPKNETDGIEIINVSQADYDTYEIIPFKDTNVKVGKTYYYAAFPYSITGAYNRIGNNANRTRCKVFDVNYELYGFDIVQEDDNPETRVSYPNDCDNYGWNPITINLDTDKYNLGNWANTFMIKNIRPVMLNTDGTVAYELDHNNQTLRIDGITPSDISDETKNMNAMVEFPKMYFKRWTDTQIINGITRTISHVRICNVQLDDNYKCYAHITDI